MNALALVPKFQERLDVSKANAIWRVIGFIFLTVCFVATIAVAATFFPYAASFTEEVALLPGNHVQVQQILDGEVLVDRAQFLEIAKGNTTFVAPGEKAIVYMAKVAGVSYRYDQTVHLRYGYSVSSQGIQNGMVIREINRSTGLMICFNLVLPLLILFFLFIFIIFTQTKKVSRWGSSAVYRKVWW